ncbi:MAG: hypothetical protein MI743_04000 [Sneathiellales bacterium]|nr:hypothetical protein [Sneathiellales bacterium]
MLKKLMISAAVGIAALTAVGVAQAASLSLVGGSAGVLPGNYDVNATGLAAGDAITVFDSSNGPGEGLVLSEASAIKFEFLGHEATFDNRAIETLGGTILSANSGFNIGDSVVVSLTPDLITGLLPFKFTTSGGGSGPKEAINGNIDDPLTMAFVPEGNDGKVFIALFGDGFGDSDFDDLQVRISVVPLPPAMALFGGALLGLGWLSRRRKQA